MDLEPERFTRVTSLLLVLATATLGLGLERLARGATLVAGTLLAIGVVAAVVAFTLELPRSQQASALLLLTREQCPLCDQAEALLRHAQEDHAFVLWTVDVSTDPALAERYTAEVPVLLRQGEVIASMDITEADIRAALGSPR